MEPTGPNIATASSTALPSIGCCPAGFATAESGCLLKRNKLIHKSGPYIVQSYSQDGRGVRLEIYPAYPQYNLSEKQASKPDIDPEWAKERRWPLHRYKDEGGGPGIFTSMALGEAFQEFLNQSYSPEEIALWEKTFAEAQKLIEKKHG